MTDKKAEVKHGKLATEPQLDVHVALQENGEMKVLVWSNGIRYSGTLKEED